MSTQEGKLVLRLEIVAVYRECGSIRETARRLSISRNTVRKWVRRYREEGEAGLYDRSRRPKRSPCRTPPEVEGRVLELKRERGWGKKRIAHALGIPEGTVRHILGRHLPEEERRPRKKRRFSTPPCGHGTKMNPSGWPRWTPRTSCTKAP